LSGDVSDESAQSIGKMLGAQYIVTGTLTNMDTYQRFRIRIINVETGAIQRQITFELKNDAQVSALLGVDEEKTANVRGNWLSGGVSLGVMTVHPDEENKDQVDLGFGFNVLYEHMLNSYFSLGLNGYLFGGEYTYRVFGVDASFQYYPFKKVVFLGVGFGYNSAITQVQFMNTKGQYVREDRNFSGLTFLLAAGAKFDIGKPGRFFFQPDLTVRFFDSRVFTGFNIGLGYAF
jgi:hypothetical protein